MEKGGYAVSDFYPIIEVRENWDIQQEDMGTKPKFWYRASPDDARWLFKYPRSNNGVITGDHLAEKVAAEVAGLLEVPHASVDLAIFCGERGSTTKSFVANGSDLFHGNQILARKSPNYNPHTKFKQSDHTLENIWSALDAVFVEPAGAEDAKLRFAAYVVLDALIGNTDRHHENWGIVRTRVKDKLVDFPETELSEVVNRVPEEWMSRSAKVFSIALMRYNLKKLREIPL